MSHMPKIVFAVGLVALLALAVWVSVIYFTPPEPPPPREVLSATNGGGTPDEVAELTRECGRPARVKEQKLGYGGRNALERRLVYGGVEFRFLRSDESPQWTLMGVSESKGGAALAAQDFHGRVPCSKRVVFALVD